jgi:hypothetical protein
MQQGRVTAGFISFAWRSLFCFYYSRKQMVAALEHLRTKRNIRGSPLSLPQHFPTTSSPHTRPKVWFSCCLKMDKLILLT